MRSVLLILGFLTLPFLAFSAEETWPPPNISDVRCLLISTPTRWQFMVFKDGRAIVRNCTYGEKGSLTNSFTSVRSGILSFTNIYHSLTQNLKPGPGGTNQVWYHVEIQTPGLTNIYFSSYTSDTNAVQQLFENIKQNCKPRNKSEFEKIWEDYPPLGLP